MASKTEINPIQYKPWYSTFEAKEFFWQKVMTVLARDWYLASDDGAINMIENNYQRHNNNIIKRHNIYLSICEVKKGYQASKCWT